MGDLLAETIKKNIKSGDVDVVMPIPDSSRPAAMQVARHLGVEYREGFFKNRYVGRTFIMPGQARRKKSVRQKLNAMSSEFKGKNVLIVDDSIPIWFAVLALVRELLVGGGTVLLALLGARRIDVLWWGKTGTFAMLFAVPSFLAGESTISINEFFAVFAYICGLPGLIISWFAAFMYIPLASEVLKERRQDRQSF